MPWKQERAICHTDKVFGLSPYHPSCEAIQDVSSVQGTITYDDQETGKPYTLILNQSLYFWRKYAKPTTS
jgi:hypothetical protein